MQFKSTVWESRTIKHIKKYKKGDTRSLQFFYNTKVYKARQSKHDYFLLCVFRDVCLTERFSHRVSVLVNHKEIMMRPRRKRSSSVHQINIINVHAVVLGLDGVGKSGMFDTYSIATNSLLSHSPWTCPWISVNRALLKSAGFFVRIKKSGMLYSIAMHYSVMGTCNCTWL